MVKEKESKGQVSGGHWANARKYEPPRVEELGTLEDLTGGATMTGGHADGMATGNTKT